MLLKEIWITNKKKRSNCGQNHKILNHIIIVNCFLKIKKCVGIVKMLKKKFEADFGPIIKNTTQNQNPINLRIF